MKKLFSLSSLLFSLFVTLCSVSCNIDTPPISSSGVAKTTTKVATDLNGHTTEQNNIIQRYAVDNQPGSIKHLYIISVYSGDVILYSTVRGKVTSSGKRLTPLKSIYVTNNGSSVSNGFGVEMGGQIVYTDEVIQDDGTYGSSVDYIYWFDSKGIYHQQYIEGGMMVHISSQPIAVKKVILNLETPEK